MNAATTALADELDRCRAADNPTDRFNSTILQRKPYWSKQREIGRALSDPRIRRVQVPSGHMTGKSFFAAGAAIDWLTRHPESGVVVVAPSLDQLRRAVWAQIRLARTNSPLLCRAGKIRRVPLSWEYGENWKLIGLSGTQPEVLQGYHPQGPVLVIRDEASAQNDPEVVKALQSLKPVKWLDLSNPIRNYGDFYETCLQARDDHTIRVIRIPSTAGPDAGKPVSRRGLADATWLRNMELDYGRGSQTWQVRVEADFPEGSADQLIPSYWLDLAVGATHQPGGRRRLAIDLSLGRGGDDAVHTLRDSNGIIAWAGDKFTTLDDSADLAIRFADLYGLEPADVSYDATGLGEEFGYRLATKGLLGALPYKGGHDSTDDRYVDARDACHFAMRRRLDPTRGDEYGNDRPIFAIPREYMQRFRREVRELTIETVPDGRMQLRHGEEVAKALRFSPDYSVTLAQSFSFAA